MKNKTKLHKIISVTIKIIIIVFSLGFIYQKIFYKENTQTILENLKGDFENKNFYYLLGIVILLMFFNWSIESIKWKFLIKKIEKIKFLKSVEAVLTGITISIFTPNRIGEYGGRVFILEKGNRWEGVFITILGSMSQLLITIALGSISFLIFVNNYININDYLSDYVYYLLIFLSVALIILLFILFFNISFIYPIAKKIKFLGKFKKYVRILSLYSAKDLLKVLFYSIFRYVIFSFQFYLLLIAFGVEMPLLEGFIFISLIFFVMAAMPTIALTELGVRGSVAIYFISKYFEKMNLLNDNIALGILTASFVLWIINLAIPAIIGSFFVFDLKFFRRK